MFDQVFFALHRDDEIKNQICSLKVVNIFMTAQRFFYITIIVFLLLSIYLIGDWQQSWLKGDISFLFTNDKELLPLKKGNKWIYDATISWTKSDSEEIESQNLKWTVEVVQNKMYKNKKVAVVKGFFQDLLWFTVDNPQVIEPKEYLIINDKGKYYLLDEYWVEEWRKHERLEDIDYEMSGEILWQEGLYEGEVFKINENWADEYQRKVEKVSETEGKLVYKIVLDTLPDKEEIEIERGTGIKAYTYEHYGVVMRVELKLRKFIEG